MTNWPIAIVAGVALGALWAWRIHLVRQRQAPGLWLWPLAAGLVFGGALVSSLLGMLAVWQFTGVLALLLAAIMGLGLLALRKRHDRDRTAGADALMTERRWSDDTITMLVSALALLIALPLLGEAAARSVALAGCIGVGVVALHAIFTSFLPR